MSLIHSVDRLRDAFGETPPAPDTIGLLDLWLLNLRLGWPERVRGLHYWLGFEYMLTLRHLPLAPGARLLDIGTGPYSIFPYLAAHMWDAHVIATDIMPGIIRQRAIRERALRAGFRGVQNSAILQADARALPFCTDSCDAVTIISTLEHIEGLHGDRDGLREVERVVRPGGYVVVSVPFRPEGSLVELDEDRRLWQRVYSEETLRTTLLESSRLQEVGRIYYGERWPFYDLSRRLPRPLDWLRRPWDTALSALLLHETANVAAASAVWILLAKPAR